MPAVYFAFLVLTLPGLAVADDGQCLLAQRSSLGRVELLSSQTTVHSAWRARHAEQVLALNKTTDALQKFIDLQSASGDACSSRLLESKRVLDGLLKDLSLLGKQVDSHEEVLQVETQNLEITEISIKTVESEYAKAVAKCKTLIQLALEDVKQYTAELKELDQIANPSTRYHQMVGVASEKDADGEFKGKYDVGVATKIDTAKEPVYAPIQQRSSLLEVGAWDREQCLAFVAFTQRHAQMARYAAAPDTRDCDVQRGDLQKAFTKAYVEVTDLLKDAKDRSVDTSCFEAAEAKKAAELVPLVAQREQAVSRVEYSSQAIAALSPVLALLMDRTEQLQEHIDETLTPECAEASEVSKVLQNVRDLILELEDCPGRSDFRLKVPAPPPLERRPLEKPVEIIAEKQLVDTGSLAPDGTVPSEPAEPPATSPA